MTNELPEWAKDGIVLESEIHYSLGDKVRMLFGWCPVYRTMIATEELPGRTQPFDTRLSMRRPGWWPFKPKLIGYSHQPDRSGA